MLKADGFDKAIIGVATRACSNDVVAYSYDKSIDVLVDQGMSHDEAVEYFHFNVVGGWVGDGTPIFVVECTPEEVEEWGE